MAGQKRTDNKGRILKDGETQRKDGTYRFTYTDADGTMYTVGGLCLLTASLLVVRTI